MTISKDALYHHVSQVARERDPFLATAGHFFVKEYVRSHLSQYGTVEVHEFSRQTKGQIHENLILKLPGQSNTKAPILIGAHYDAVPGSPGADDNATGVAALLELAHWFSQQPARHPVHLVAFDLEEFGLMGSTAYATMLRSHRQPLRLMLSLEMLGYCSDRPNSQRYPPGLKYLYPTTGNFIGLIGNWSTLLDLRHLKRAIKSVGVPCEWLPAGQRGKLIPDTRRSDHAPFWDQGYRAVMVTDTANLRNPHYHQPSDRLETINFEFLTGVCQGLANGIATL
ncbi:MAG: M28 family peptidase [Synechococcales cyanobacterium T60_A2020_003]|nr:M28 family peptidase [Synechococcales cyanobacterium T60_A2020_003]